jgi:hypothetical protein
MANLYEHDAKALSRMGSFRSLFAVLSGELSVVWWSAQAGAIAPG